MLFVGLIVAAVVCVMFFIAFIAAVFVLDVSKNGFQI